MERDEVLRLRRETKMPVTIDLTASRRLAAKLEARFPSLTKAEKEAVVLDLKKNHRALAEGLAFVWDLV